MPIKPKNRDRYPADWKQIRKNILERAYGQCECCGECGHNHRSEPFSDVRCQADDGCEHPITGSKVVLTIAHLDHTPENCDPDNLCAMCQRCHLAYDAESHAVERYRAHREALEDAGQGTLALDPAP